MPIIVKEKAVKGMSNFPYYRKKTIDQTNDYEGLTAKEPFTTLGR
jgi:hypothetical protein